MEIVLVLICLFLLGRWLILTRISSKEKKPISTGNNSNIDPQSGEVVRDSVKLEEAEVTKGEVYLLAECSLEQCAEFERNHYPVKLGYFKKEGWTGGLPFYLFKCPQCAVFRVDYKHDLIPFLMCDNCELKIPFAFFGKKLKLKP
jgi:hypothetical protein